MQTAIATLTRSRIFLFTAIALGWAASAGASQAEPLRLITSVNSNFAGDKGDGKGPDIVIDLLRQVFAAMGQDVAFEYFPQTRAWSMIAGGERDGLTVTYRTSAREQVCAFPDEPLERDGSVLFVRTADIGKLKFTSFDDLAGHDVAVNKSFAPDTSHPSVLSPELEQFLREHHNMTETDGDVQALSMLAAGRVDYVVMGRFVGTLEVQRNGFSGKIEQLPSRSIIERDLDVCFTRGRVSPAFVDAFSRALKQFKQTDAYREILHKYMP